MASLAGLHYDLSHHHPDLAARERSDNLFQLLTPVVKSFLTDEGYACVDAALQSMGGSGFTQDWPVEQLLRDGRIARIYEGTNGIQAMDLVGRKLTMKKGSLPKTYFDEMQTLLSAVDNEIHLKHCNAFISTLQAALVWLGKNAASDPEQAGAVASTLLRMFALTTLAVLWAKMAAQASQEETQRHYSAEFLEGKNKAAEHYFRLYAPEMVSLLKDLESGKRSIMNFSTEEF